jgi:hypothetical protein
MVPFTYFTIFPFSGFRFNPPDVAVLPFEDDVQPLRIRIPKHEKIVIRIANLDGSVIDAHRFRGNFVLTDDPGQALTQYLFNFDDRCRGDDLALMVIVVALSPNQTFFILQNLLFDFVHCSRNRRIHIRRNFFGMIKIAAGLDVQLGDVTLVFFNCQDTVDFLDCIDTTTQSIETIRGEFPNGFGDLDMPARDIDTHWPSLRTPGLMPEAYDLTRR